MAQPKGDIEQTDAELRRLGGISSGAAISAKQSFVDARYTTLAATASGGGIGYVRRRYIPRMNGEAWR